MAVYLDNAATSYPKPEGVAAAVANYITNIGASPARGGYSLSIQAGRMMFRTRRALASFFGCADEDRVVFAPSVTYALNCAIQGLLRPGDHIVTTSMEHNSVIRPLRTLARTQLCQLTVVECESNGTLDLDRMSAAIRSDTRMVVTTHASNVCGTVIPIAEIAEMAASVGAFFVVDAAQTAGVLPLTFDTLGADVLAFTGHKALLGPAGTGGMVLSPRAAHAMNPLAQGGTGSRSDDEYQPDFLPDKFEPGTPNTPGIIGLGAGVEYILDKGIENIHRREISLASSFARGIRAIPTLKLHGLWSDDPDAVTDDRVATVSISSTDPDIDMASVAFALDCDYGVMIRPGLHCAPLAHKTMSTFPTGTLRFSFGPFNTEQDVDTAIEALSNLLAPTAN